MSESNAGAFFVWLSIESRLCFTVVRVPEKERFLICIEDSRIIRTLCSEVTGQFPQASWDLHFTGERIQGKRTSRLGLMNNA